MASKVLSSANCPVEPLEDYVLLRRIKSEKTAGGILLPDDNDPKKRMLVKGVVIAAGPGRLMENGVNRPMSVKPGDTVFFSVQSIMDLGLDIKTFLSEQGFDPEATAAEIVFISQGNIVLRAKS